MSIRIITEPAVRIIGRMQADEGAISDWVHESGGPRDWWPDPESSGPEKLVETATRACYWSYANPRPGGFKALADRVLSEGHGSVAEHAVYTVAIAGVSRSLTHELIRHRHLSPSQLSQRYVDESDCAFVVPPALVDEVKAGIAWRKTLNSKTGVYYPRPIASQEDEGVKWLLAVEHAAHYYRSFSDYLASKYAHIDDKTARHKHAREAARSVLPNCVETRLVLTGNARAWRGVLEQRGSDKADAEIRRLAFALLPLFQAESPHLFGDMHITDLPDGGQAVTTPYRKV